MKIALIKNNKVINIIQADTLQWAQQNYPDCVVQEATPELEKSFSSSQSPFFRPSTKMTKYQFRKRFTFDELLKFDNPELYISNLTDQQRAIIKTLTRSFDAATEIDLTDSQLQYGMQLMVDWGLITEERKNSILSVE